MNNNLILLIFIILAGIVVSSCGAFMSRKINKETSYRFLAGVAVFIIVGSFTICNEIKIINKQATEGKLFTYEAVLKDSRVVDAKNCNLHNENKVCDVLVDERKMLTEKYIVEDFWEKGVESK